MRSAADVEDVGVDGLVRWTVDSGQRVLMAVVPGSGRRGGGSGPVFSLPAPSDPHIYVAVARAM